VIGKLVNLSLKKIEDRGPHLVNPFAFPQTLLTVSGKFCGLNVIVLALSVYLADIDVAEAKGVADIVV
jgi:hypothetical protein